MSGPVPLDPCGVVVTKNQGPGDDGVGHDLEEVATARRAKGSMRTMALTGGRWRVLEGVALQGLQIVPAIVLARLLTPDDFGIFYAMVLAAAPCKRR